MWNIWCRSKLRKKEIKEQIIDWFDEFDEDEIVASLYQKIIITNSMGEFVSIAMNFQDLVADKRIIDPQHMMVISSLLMSKQNDLAVREMYGKVETIMQIFEPDKEILALEQSLEREEEFEGENIVSLKNWKNDKGKK